MKDKILELEKNGNFGKTGFKKDDEDVIEGKYIRKSSLIQDDMSSYISSAKFDSDYFADNYDEF